MDHYKFGIQRKRRATPFVVREKDFEILGFWVIRLAVQSVVEGFCYIEKFLSSRHHVPAKPEIELFCEGHKAVENFRNAAANRGGVDHFDAAAAQRFGQGAQFLDLAGAYHLRIVFERDAACRQNLRHAFLLSRSIRRSILARALSSVLV